MEKKICSKCKEEKEVCEFGKDKTKKSGYKSQCKKCANITTKKYKLLKTYEKHFDIISIKKKEYARKNKIKDNLRRKNKYHADPSYKLKVNLRRRISFYLKSKNIIKTNTTFDIIGCSPEFLKEHIEKQFTEGMSWDLLGKHIHIDHIIPLSSAKNENELYELCRYTNLQPLWAEDNLKKSNKIL
jgi:hypothetical protein